MTVQEVSYNVEPGTTLSPEQLAAAAYEAGFSDPANLATIVNIAEVQSGGDPGAIGIGVPPGDTEYSVGLTQINVAPGANPGIGKQYGPTGLLTPISNFAAAHQLFSADGFSPWSEGHLQSSAEVVAENKGGPGAEAAQQIAAESPTTIANLANAADASAQASLKAEGDVLPPTYGTSSPPAAFSGAKVSSSLSQGNIPSATTTSATSTTGSAGGLANTTAQQNAFGRVLIAMNGWLNPAGPGVGVVESILTLGSADLASKLIGIAETAGIRLAFALPGFVVLFLALGVSLAGFVGDIIKKSPIGTVASSVAKG